MTDCSVTTKQLHTPTHDYGHKILRTNFELKVVCLMQIQYMYQPVLLLVYMYEP